METKTYKKKHSPCFNFSKEEVNIFLKEIKNEFYSHMNSIEKESSEKNNIKVCAIKDRSYILRYNQYMETEFNSAIVNMIVIYIEKINSFPEQYKNEANFIYKMVNLIKHFLMNEIEVACFTLLLDKIGYTYKDKEKWLYYSILCILSKIFCGKEDDILLVINSLSQINIRFMDEYKSFINDSDIIKKIKENETNLKQINERFIILSKPINTYCRKNYISLKGISDKIIKTSSPYFKEDLVDKEKKINSQGDINNFLENENVQKINEDDTPQKISGYENIFDNTNIKENEISCEEMKNADNEYSWPFDEDSDKNNFNNENWTISNLDNKSF